MKSPMVFIDKGDLHERQGQSCQATSGGNLFFVCGNLWVLQTKTSWTIENMFWKKVWWDLQFWKFWNVTKTAGEGTTLLMGIVQKVPSNVTFTHFCWNAGSTLVKLRRLGRWSYFHIIHCRHFSRNLLGPMLAGNTEEQDFPWAVFPSKMASQRFWNPSETSQSITRIEDSSVEDFRHLGWSYFF